MRKNDRGVILLCEAADRLDKTVWCYTELRGLICGTAKGAQSGKNRFGGSLEPFNEVELVLYEKEGTGRPIIESASIVDPTLSLREDWVTALSFFSIVDDKEKLLSLVIDPILKRFENIVGLEKKEGRNEL